jgi:hypothetical protein
MSGGWGPGNERHRYTTFPAERQVLAWLLAESRYLAGWPAMVEIGAREGDTSEYLAQRRDYRRFIVIDPWDGTQDGAGDDVYRTFMARMAPHMKPIAYGTTGLQVPPVEVWRARSQTVTPPADLGFVFHDGDHREPDFAKWYDALVPGGVLVVHDTADTGWPEVRRACLALGEPWHEYLYQPSAAERAEYGPGIRGLWWKTKH